MMQNQLCYYDHETGQLTGRQKDKAKYFVKAGAVIKTVFRDRWIVKHIPGYNKSDYTVQNTDHGWACSCQYNTVNKKICSHILAVSMKLRGIK